MPFADRDDTPQIAGGTTDSCTVTTDLGTCVSGNRPNRASRDRQSLFAGRRRFQPFVCNERCYNHLHFVKADVTEIRPYAG